MLLIISVTLVGIGFKTGNPLFFMIGAVLAIGLGAIVLSEGLITPKITGYEIDDVNALAPAQVTPTYEHLTSATIEIAVLGYLLLGGGVIFLILTFYYSIFGEHPESNADSEVL